MNDVSKEYSEALFALAVESSKEREYAEAIGNFRTAVGAAPSYIELLVSPCVPLSERKSLIDEVFKGGDEVELNIASFAKLLCEKGHIRELFEIIDETLRMLKSAEGISTARVTSAVEMTEDEKSELADKLSKKLGHGVELECSVDESLLGGVIVEVDGKVIDGSLRYKLQNIKEVIK